MSRTRFGLENTECGNCECDQAVAWVPSIGTEDEPLASLVIHPVCRACLADYLRLLDLSQDGREHG